ncbi:MAG: N-6 DNA methylase [Ruminiclostridium sp.]|nr:N-6 DNA methylase [Ruminiclostridium sp.]
MTKEKLQELRNLDTSKVEFYLINELKGITGNAYYAAFSTAYVIVKSSENITADISSFENFSRECAINSTTIEFLSYSLKGVWDFIARAKGMFDTDMYLAFLLFSDLSDTKSDLTATPDSISELAIRLLDIQKSDRVADYFTGRASFIRECIVRNLNAKYFGFDICDSLSIIATIRAEFLQSNIEIVQQNVLSMDYENKFNKIFANYPFGVRVTSTDNSNALQFLNKRLSMSKKVIFMDWLANTTIINTLAPNGKAVSITTTGALFRGDERDIRKYFIDNGYINTIIALPTGMFETTRISTILIVFSHNNQSVRFVDARQICTKGRRYNTFSKENIDEIINLCSNDDKLSKLVSKNEIIDKDYNLDPNTYFEAEINIPHGTMFETVIKNITRGAQLTANQLDELSSNEPTEYQYLMLSDIRNGQIAEDLSYITTIENNLLKYCIKDKSIIISKSAAPIKTAVASVSEKVNLLATGNLYVVEVDTDKINPYFLKSFLDSDVGILSLKSICAGTTIPNIPIESLKKMIIPVPSMDVQNTIAEKYTAAQKECAKLQEQLKQTEIKMRNIYEENIS